MDKEVRDEISTIKASLEELHKKIDTIARIEKLNAQSLLKIEELERSELEYVDMIKGMETKELQNLENIEHLENKELSHMTDMYPKKFPTIPSWKTNIWDNCPNRLMNESKLIVSFKCRVNSKICSFENCPINRINGNQE